MSEIGHEHEGAKSLEESWRVNLEGGSAMRGNLRYTQDIVWKHYIPFKDKNKFILLDVTDHVGHCMYFL